MELPKIDQAALDVAGKIFIEGRKNSEKQEKVDKEEWEKMFSEVEGYSCPVCKSIKVLQKDLNGTMLGHCINGHGGMWAEFETAKHPKKQTKKELDKLKKKAENKRLRIQYAINKAIKKFAEAHLPAEDNAILGDKTASADDRAAIIQKHGLKFNWHKVDAGPRKGHWLFVKYMKDGKELAWNQSLQIELQ